VKCIEEKKLDLKDRIAVITGGGGGIGGAIATRLAGEGIRIIIVDYSQPNIDRRVSALNESGGSAVGLRADVSSQDDVSRVFVEIIKSYGKMDILVNAAGIQGPIGLVTDNSRGEWIRTIEINLIGTFLCIEAALPSMIKNRYGKIINFSGGGSTSPRSRFSAYAVSKTGVVRLTETLAEEMKPFRIDINAIAPGAVNTRMTEEVLQAGQKAAGDEYAETIQRKNKGGTPPTLAAELSAFLASSTSDGITGKLISAPWDPWRDETFQERLRKDKDLATLRRIDEKSFYRKS
jgi:NAD(P)-dependent dehydrogenase (short-subunit alcohol dehydrogenase family)